ncbi:MAG: thioredoxin family protein [Planctomycetales bacterium]|nr:thioredoxin family protein [Planctomycetales bacterium]
MSSILVGLVVAPALFNAVMGAPPDGKVVWHDNFNRALEEATRRDCVLLVHFHATWCPPCKRMEREVLNTPEMLRFLEAGVVAVKVDGEMHPDLKDRFDIEAFPSDVIITPQGRVLNSSQGYQSKDSYLSTLARADARYEAIKKQGVAKTKPQSRSQSDGPGIDGQRPPAANSVTTGLVGLDGYCPVTLRTTRTWKLGSKDFSCIHQGQTYYLFGSQELQEFKAQPERYAPKFLGCDPVVLTETSVAVAGDTRWGAYFDGQLFLFESTGSRTRFKATPTKYVRSQQSLKPSDIRPRTTSEGDTQISSRDSNKL